MNCQICKKKLDLAQQIVGKCRCKSLFCSAHRYPAKHNCTFDMTKINNELLKKNNPLIQADKMSVRI